MGLEDLYYKETGRDPYSHCHNCGRHSAYRDSFLEWCLERQSNLIVDMIKKKRAEMEQIIENGDHSPGDGVGVCRELIQEIESLSFEV